jgi:alpha-galactosidase
MTSSLCTFDDRRVIALTVVAALAVSVLPARADDVVLSVRDAYVSRDARAQTWTIGNDDLAVKVGFAGGNDFRLLDLRNPALDWGADITPMADAVLTLNGDQFAVGAKSDGFTFSGFDTSPLPNGVRLDVLFELRNPRARVTRTYLCYSGAPLVETFVTLVAGSPLAVSDLNVWQLGTPRGVIRWLTGLQAPESRGGSFTVHRDRLQTGEQLSLGAGERASELTVPVFAVELQAGELIGGLMWPGAWSGTVAAPDEDRFSVSVGVTGFRSQVPADERFETPHGFFGVAADPLATSAALARFALAIRNDRPFPALVAYNTWFPYGTRIDEETVLNEMERVASEGAEVFVLDAGWYPDTGLDGVFDFTSGLGAWRADESRFPSGLAFLADRAHELGMKFGIWVEPARTALSRVDAADGPRETWLATRDGKYTPGDETPVAAQICLAGAAGRAWLLDRLTAFIEQVRPDYLKWDNNFFINCDRAGHGHTATDGNLRHNAALLEMLATLRERFPDLVIENVSGGGNVLDFSMLRVTDVGWMDDQSAPSSHVRHNLEGLSGFFPPAYLFSFVMGDAEEPFHGTSDMGLVTRSRMPGALGLTYRSNELAESEGEELSIQIGQYKTFRDTIRHAGAVLLTPQADHRAGGAWDVLQEASDSREVVIFAFQQPGAPERTVVRPRSLLPNALYTVTSIDRGDLGEAKGRDLMAEGIEILESPVSAAHIIVLRPRFAAEPARKK